MTEAVPDAPAADLAPLTPKPRPLATWLSHGLSLLLIVAVVLQLRHLGPAELIAAIPRGWAFPIAFAALYFAQPVADWLIFRLLWRLPASGFTVILRKRIANELLIDYSGETYFYLWARRHARLTTAPFGAIKDVNILSALISNIVTLGLLALAYPMLVSMSGGEYARPAAWSAGIMVAISLLALLLRKKLFSLSARQLWQVAGIHAVRIAVTTFLLGLVWHIALPEVSSEVWIAMSALRLVITRLPFLPGREVLFTAVGMYMLGGDGEVPILLALTTGLMLLMHLVVAALLALAAWAEPGDDPDLPPEPAKPAT